LLQQTVPVYRPKQLVGWLFAIDQAHRLVESWRVGFNVLQTGLELEGTRSSKALSAKYLYKGASGSTTATDMYSTCIRGGLRKENLR
jgi:hypothetical protein